MAAGSALADELEAACKGVSDATNPKQAWDDVKRLRAGLAPARRHHGPTANSGHCASLGKHNNRFC